jgi:hypothetical protein
MPKEIKDIKSLLLVLLSIGLVSTWIYHIYDKTIYSQRRTEVYVKDSAAVADAIKDSLTKIYSTTISELDYQLNSTRLNADSLKTRLDDKLEEINRLKMEIAGILNKQGFSKSDLSLARQKINELQQRADELTGQNLNMEDEKKHLSTVLEQLTLNVDTLQRNIRRLSDENQSLIEKVNLASIFIASDIKIDAIEVKGSSEESTSQAKKTDKFVASFVVQNRITQFDNAELTTVLIQPDGQALQSTVWDSGSFDTKNEGKKKYTRKIRFDYVKGEEKHLLFSIETEKCQKGTYTFQLWHNGILIGQATKTLG